MSKRALIVLAICLVLGGGFVAYVWANGCCGDSDPLCNGGVAQITDTCNFYFDVDHDRDTGGGTHDVYLMIKKSGDPTFMPELMSVGSLFPYPVCVNYVVLLTDLDANVTYYYHFECKDCDGRDPNSGDYTLLTGDCD